MAKFAVVDGCVAPAKLAPVLTEIKTATGCVYASIYRGADAATELHSLGKHTQAEIYAEYLAGTEPNPANPPGRSTHEQRSDAVAYPGPIGRHLAWWQCGIDVDDAHVAAFVAAAAKHEWVAFRPYASGAEYHHVDFKALPQLFVADFKRGSQGPNVLLFTQRLVKLGYLGRRWFHFNPQVELAVKKFQRDHHYTADGVVGPVTWTAIKQLAGVVERHAKHPPAVTPTKPKRKPARKPVAPATTVTKAIVGGIAGFEGGKSSDGLYHPYFDRMGNLWTQGFGHTVGVTASSKPWTETEARQVLEQDLNMIYGPAVLAAAKKYGWLPLDRHEFGALVSFAFNLGPAYFTPLHTLGAALQKHDLKAAAAAFLLYDKDANGVVEPGLQRRRKWEQSEFEK